jgi:hypothetical protein
MDALRRVPAGDPRHAEAMEKEGKILYVFGQEKAAAQDYHEALLSLYDMPRDSPYWARSRQLIEQIRPVAMFRAAQRKAEVFNFYLAIQQARRIPPGTEAQRLADAVLPAWRQLLRRHGPGDLGYPRLRGYAAIATALARIGRGERPGPEAFTTSNRRGGKRKTWWHNDYSHATFNEGGRLVAAEYYDARGNVRFVPPLATR